MKHAIWSMLVAVLLSATFGCEEEEPSFEGTLLSLSDGLPHSGVKDFTRGDNGGTADWFKVSGATIQQDYIITLTMPNNDGDDLRFTAVKTFDGFGPDHDLCNSSGRAEDAGQSCTITPTLDTFFVYITKGFTEDGVNNVSYSLNITKAQ